MELSFLKNAKVVGDEDKVKVEPKQEQKEEVNQEEVNETTQEEQVTTEEQPQTNNKDEKEEELQQAEGQEQNEEQKQDVQEEVSLKDDDVLKFLKEKGIEAESLEDLSKPKQEKEIPQELQSYLDYKKETNRSYQDFLELQKDWSKESEEATLKRYIKDKNPFFSDEDIKDELNEFKVDEDIDDDSEVRKKNRKKKKLLSEAVSYLESQKEKYKAPVEGSSTSEVQIPEEYKEAKTKLSEVQRLQEEQQNVIKQRHENFLKETQSVFSQDFEGFEFELGGQKKVFKSGDSQSLAKMQSDVNNFIGKFTDENGAIKDVKGYHKALNAAMNADAMAKHFYELGKSEAIAEETKESKNINFSGHKSSESNPKKGFTMKAINPGQPGIKFNFRKK